MLLIGLLVTEIITCSELVSISDISGLIRISDFNCAVFAFYVVDELCPDERFRTM